MGKEFERKDTPEAIKKLLTKFRSDVHLSETFEGTAKNGKLTGSYCNLAALNGIVIGYVKITGQYDLQRGTIHLKAIPNKLFWIVIAFLLLGIGFLLARGFIDNSFEIMGISFLLFFAGIFTMIFLLERRHFYKEMDRIAKSI